MYVVRAGWENYTFEELEAKLTGAAGRGCQAICRVYLEWPGNAASWRTNPGANGSDVPAFLRPGLKFFNYSDSTGSEVGVTPDWSNAKLQKAMLQLIAKLGEVYDGDKRVAYWQVGFLGKWGEWHDEPHSLFASTHLQREVLMAFNSSFTKTPTLARYPDTIGGLRASSLRIGYHDDSFGQDTLDDPKASWHFMARMATAKAMDVWKTAPIGGEVRPELQKCLFAPNITEACADSGQTPEDFGECVAQSHSSWQCACSVRNLQSQVCRV